MRRRILFVATTTLVVIAVGIVLSRRYQDTLPDAQHRAVARRGTIEATISALGRVAPKRQLALSTQVGGKVRRILIQEGHIVEEGTLLLELDAREYHNAIERAERRLRARQLQLEQALQAPTSASIDLARARLRRATVVRQRAQQDYDEIADQPEAETSDEALELEAAKLEYEIANAEFDRVMEGTPRLELERLRLEAEEAELALQQAREQLEYTRIRAPCEGTILSIGARVGENVHGYGPLISLADLSRLEIRAEINEIDVASVTRNQRVRIRLDAFPARELHGTIAGLLPGPSPTRGTTVYEAAIDFDAQTLPIRPGMGANLVITTESVEGALLVPRRAVRRVGRHQVVRLLEGRRQAEVIVLTGVSNDSEIQVLSGLEAGQVVLLE